MATNKKTKPSNESMVDKKYSYYTTKNFIAVSDFNSKTSNKYGYKNIAYLPKTKENMDKISRIKGKPDKDEEGRFLWQ